MTSLKDMLQGLQHRKVFQMKKKIKISKTVSDSENLESLRINENHRAKEIHGLLKDIVDIQLEKIKLEQQIKEATLQQQKQKLCKKLAGLRLKKSQDFPTKLQKWCEEFKVLQKEGGQSFKVNNGTECCQVSFGKVSYSESASSSASIREAETETLDFCIICNSSQFGVHVQMVKQVQPELTPVECGESTDSEAINGDVSVYCDVYVAGLGECITTHLCKGTCFCDLLQDVVHLIYSTYLANISG